MKEEILYFVILILSHILGDSFIGINHNHSFEAARIGDILFSRHYLIQRLFSYIGTFFLSIGLSIFESPKECWPYMKERFSYNKYQLNEKMDLNDNESNS